VNTSLIYYPSIKIVRKLFGLKGFWNIHFVRHMNDLLGFIKFLMSFFLADF